MPKAKIAKALNTAKLKQIKKDLLEIKPGYVVRVYEKLDEKASKKTKKKQRTQIFEGLVLRVNGGKNTKNIGATMTVRKIAAGKVGVEKIFPINSPVIEKIEIIKAYKVKRKNLAYLREKSAQFLRRYKTLDVAEIESKTENKIESKPPVIPSEAEVKTVKVVEKKQNAKK